MDRRHFLTATLSLPALVLPGCAILGGLFRFGARGGLVRSGARGARMSPNAAVLTLGRAASATLHLVRLANAANQIREMQTVGQIVSTETGNIAVDIIAKDGLCETYVDNAAISTTERKGIYSTHYVNLYGRQFETGHSVIISDREVEHRDFRNRFLGADRFENDTIHHFDAKQRLKGRTPLKIDRTAGNESAVVTDDSYLMEELEKTARSAHAEFGDGFSDSAAIVQKRTECLHRSADRDCRDLVSAANEALQRLEKNFR